MKKFICRYTKEFREEAARLSLPNSTVENWIRAAKAGKLGEVGKNRKPLTEVEIELARVKRDWLLPGWSVTF